MKIAIVGTGYVGLVTGACFSEMGIDVTCIDVVQEKIDNLKKGILPIYEPGLENIVTRNYEAGRLTFTSELASVINEVDVVFSAVGTPSDEDGSADLQYVLGVARSIGKLLNHYILVVTKSTVPVGTAEKVRKVIQDELCKRNVKIDFDVASNPEFLKEGNAIEDFMKPDRVVIGVESERAKNILECLYKPFMMNNYRIIFTDVPSAEMIKYAANSMLATRISFMNDVANLCELVGADINMVRKGIGADSRIGNKFLYSGCGYGGSCFPKDVKALIKTAAKKNYEMKVLKAVEEVNEMQKSILFEKLLKYFDNNIEGKRIALWGLSFKPETDDMRESPALVLINKIVDAGASVNVYDPIAMEECKSRIGDKVSYAKSMYDAVWEVDALLLITEWKLFRLPDWSILYKMMRHPLILDGRNIYNKQELCAKGFKYEGIGLC
ncbi:UDP-glucose dehydrogenase family protein [Bacteroides sp.]